MRMLGSVSVIGASSDDGRHVLFTRRTLAAGHVPYLSAAISHRDLLLGYRAEAGHVSTVASTPALS